MKCGCLLLFLLVSSCNCQNGPAETEEQDSPAAAPNTAPSNSTNDTASYEQMHHNRFDSTPG
ncbi:MAG: hypothetical protein ACK4E0_14620 [Chitinophagaceae bacterium]